MGPKNYYFVEILLVALISIDTSSSSKWSYVGNTGPSHWHELFPEACSGKMQSPINIDPEKTTYDQNLKEFAIWYDPPRKNAKMFVKNNGHAVQIDTVGDFFVTNGGLDNVYKTAQFHFHWGHANHHGSEHHLAGKPHPLELHIVNFNSDLYGTISEAATQPRGLAVLGVLFEIVDEKNEILDPIIEAMKEVRDPDKDQLVEIKAVSLRDLLPMDLSRYFRYNGSLTTPGCFESVVWTVFEQPQKVSLEQLLEFRQVLKPKHMKHKGRKNKGHRHTKRSAAEHNAKEVLDELGIRGNNMAEDELKVDLMETKMKEGEMAPVSEQPLPEAEQPAASAEEPVHEPELDEDSARRAQDNMHMHLRESAAKEEKARLEHEKHMEENEEMTEYVQEILVNNFRPIQPINNRRIHRSFKLRQPVLVGAQDNARSPHYAVNENNRVERVKTAQAISHDHNAAAVSSISAFTVIAIAVLSLFHA